VYGSKRAPSGSTHVRERRHCLASHTECGHGHGPSRRGVRGSYEKADAACPPGPLFIPRRCPQGIGLVSNSPRSPRSPRSLTANMALLQNFMEMRGAAQRGDSSQPLSSRRIRTRRVVILSPRRIRCSLRNRSADPSSFLLRMTAPSEGGRGRRGSGAERGIPQSLSWTRSRSAKPLGRCGGAAPLRVASEAPGQMPIRRGEGADRRGSVPRTRRSRARQPAVEQVVF